MPQARAESASDRRCSPVPRSHSLSQNLTRRIELTFTPTRHPGIPAQKSARRQSRFDPLQTVAASSSSQPIAPNIISGSREIILGEMYDEAASRFDLGL